MTQRIKVMKAEPIGTMEVPDFIIETVPASFVEHGDETGTEFFKRCQEEHRAEAIALLDVLSDSLPQGTMDALLYLLLERKATILRVPGYGV
jgi:hypothetical protein